MKKSQLDKCRDILERSFPTSLPFKDWQDSLILEGVGYRDDRYWVLEYDDLDRLRMYLESLGFSGDKLSNQNSRLETSISQRNEKEAGSFTKNRALVQFTDSVCLNGQAMPLFRSLDVTREELFSLSPSAVVMIENFEVYIMASKYKKLMDVVPEGSVLIYRGGPHYVSTTPIEYMKHLERSKTERIAFFDPDPAGASLFGLTCFDSAIVNAHSLSNMDQKLCKKSEFSAQDIQYHNTLKAFIENMPAEYASHCKDILDGQYAFTQEAVLESFQDLKKVRLGL